MRFYTFSLKFSQLLVQIYKHMLNISSIIIISMWIILKQVFKNKFLWENNYLNILHCFPYIYILEQKCVIKYKWKLYILSYTKYSFHIKIHTLSEINPHCRTCLAPRRILPLLELQSFLIYIQKTNLVTPPLLKKGEKIMRSSTTKMPTYKNTTI